MTNIEFFLKKYHPKSSNEIIGQESAIHKLKHFILNYKDLKKKYPAALVHGPIGTGKTSAVHAIANELNYDILELNSSDARNKASINEFLSAALNQQSLFMRPKIILIDELDNFSGRKDRGGIGELAKVIKTSKFPIVCTANDITHSKVKPLKKIAMDVEFQKVPHEDLTNFLNKITNENNINVEQGAISALSRQSDGDLRSALIDLQTLAPTQPITIEKVTSLDDRKRTQTIIHALRIVFKSSSAKTAKEAFRDVDIDMDKLFMWMDKNISKEYQKPQEILKAYEHLSRADIFRRRIRRWQHWRFMVYIFDLLSAGISTAKEERNPNFIKYEESKRVLKIWMSKMKLGKRNDIAAKLAKHTHTSKKRAIQMMPYIKQTFKKSDQSIQDNITKDLKLEKDEIVWLNK